MHCKVLDERERIMEAGVRLVEATLNGTNIIAVTLKGMEGLLTSLGGRSRTSIVSLTFVVQCQLMATISLVTEGRHSAKHMECRRLPTRSTWH